MTDPFTVLEPFGCGNKVKTKDTWGLLFDAVPGVLDADSVSTISEEGAVPDVLDAASVSTIIASIQQEIIF
jgi:hypothetical protein